MRIAVFIDTMAYGELDPSVRQVLLMDIEQGVISKAGNEVLSLDNHHYLMLWLVSKKVERVYTDRQEIFPAELLQRAGITLHPFSEIKDNPLLKSLLL